MTVSSSPFSAYLQARQSTAWSSTGLQNAEKPTFQAASSGTSRGISNTLAKHQTQEASPDALQDPLEALFREPAYTQEALALPDAKLAEANTSPRSETFKITSQHSPGLLQQCLERCANWLEDLIFEDDPTWRPVGLHQLQPTTVMATETSFQQAQRQARTPFTGNLNTMS